MTNPMQWRKAPDFAEIADALGCDTVDIMAAMLSPDGSYIAMFAPVPADDDPAIYSSKLARDADDILVASPWRFVERTSTFMARMDEQVAPKLEEMKRGFTPGYHGTIPPYDVEPDDEDPEERDE